MDRVDAVVIGAGVVGLAIARALAQAGHEVMVLDAEDAIGTGTSARNSEVIHAGIYYPAGSLKAELCVDGKRRLYAYCAERGIEHRRCGKLIVATSPEQVDELHALKDKAAINGVTDLQWLSREQARALEPALECVAALLSPSSGIIDSHGLMLSLQGDLERAGGMVALHAPVQSMQCRSRTRDEHVVQVGAASPHGTPATTMELACRILVNAAGLYAPRLARRMQGLAADHVPRAYFAKGNYYALSGRAPFTRLVYPVPEKAGLGVHLTLDLGGQAKFGPDVQWLDIGEDGPIDYTVDPARANAFYHAIRRYWPALPDGALHPAYAGVRPKIQAPHEPAKDFMIQGPEAHGIPGLVNLFGIESPGLTAALAIGETVTESLKH